MREYSEDVVAAVKSPGDSAVNPRSVTLKPARIVLSTVTVALNDLVTQLVKVDYGELARRLKRIRRLNDELAEAIGDVERERHVVTQRRAEVDAAFLRGEPHLPNR